VAVISATVTGTAISDTIVVCVDPATQIDEYNGSITYGGGFCNTSNNASGYYQLTKHSSATSGRYAEYTFTSSSIGVYAKKSTIYSREAIIKRFIM